MTNTFILHIAYLYFKYSVTFSYDIAWEYRQSYICIIKIIDQFEE